MPLRNRRSPRLQELGQALRQSSGQALRQSSRQNGGQALRQSSGQALRQSSGQARRSVRDFPQTAYSAVSEIGTSNGQAGIVVLLLTVVLLTIGLSIASRSVTDVRLSRQEEETSRAFDAAEAGIEDALRKDLAALVGTGGTVTVGDVTADYQVSQHNDLATDIDEGETVEVNLSGFTGTGVQIEWARTGEVCSGGDLFASIVVAIFDSSGRVRRTPYTQTGCDRGDSFVRSAGPGAAPYLLRITQAVGASDIFMRIRAVYSDTQIKVTGVGASLPLQYYLIHSEARTTGGETRAVEVTQTSPAPPSLFDFVIFSRGNIE